MTIEEKTMPKKQRDPYSNPRNVIRETSRVCRKIGELVEEAHRDLFNLYWAVKNNPHAAPDDSVLKRLDKATDQLADVNRTVEDVSYQLKELLK
jgi:hypothetical protein